MAVRPGDSHFEETVLRWFDEADSEYDSHGSDQEFEDHMSEHSHVGSEMSSSDNEDENEDTTVQESGVSIKGPKGAAKSISTELEGWKLLVSDGIINKIVLHTNSEIGRKKMNYTENCGYVGETDTTELLALFGLLYISGCRKDNHLTTAEMWSKFDDKTARNREDKFSPIREIWEEFESNCTKYYTPHEYVTIDEQLLGFRGNCPFRVYIASKPDKYGLKIVTMCDSRTFYMVSAIPYIGKEVRANAEPLPHYYVKKLSESIHGTGRNITMDNWFTSIPLADNMVNNYNLTIVGTLRKNKKEVPSSFLANKNKEALTSQFAFDQKKTWFTHIQSRGRPEGGPYDTFMAYWIKLV
ncbi:piggyBac transposable element-derived protein 4-like [Zophobas morio]|uniref:piggyBac transposable element-derived protein 4-like n=1 Tax=Zophobas morio TaxID=2755281 RepID=UPI003083AB6A